MTPFADFVVLCRRLESVSGRLEKRRLTAVFLARLAPDEIGPGVAFLQARAFPASDPRVLNVRGLPVVGGERDGEPLVLSDVVLAFAEVADAAGAGSRRAREERLVALARRASPDERQILHRIVTGEMRTGVSEGLVLEAIAALAGGDLAATRRAALFLGDLSAVAILAASGGAAALAGVAPRPFVPLLPMLAEVASDAGEALAAHGGRTALEYKYDGARIQLHRHGDRVQIWSRRLSDEQRGQDGDGGAGVDEEERVGVGVHAHRYERSSAEELNRDDDRGDGIRRARSRRARTGDREAQHHGGRARPPRAHWNL
jgi:DNA ligase-1